jgi:hypothetical protein
VTEWGKFDEMDERNARTIDCVVCEAMCPDAVDGALTEPERRVFDGHIAQCAACAKELEEAQRGAAWLGMLKGHTPEPPAALLAKILAETTGFEETEAVQNPVAEFVPPIVIPAHESAPAWALSSILRKVADAFRIETARATFQPRMAMTAAMAFVSIALTLNLTGVRLKNLRASDFTPSGLRRNVAEASATAARNFQNMRVVYQVESRVSELRGEGPLAQHEDVTFTPQSSTTPQPEQQARPAPRRKGL